LIRKEKFMEPLALRVPGMTCDHCVEAVRGEISKVAGVSSVDVDLGSKGLVVHGRAVDRAAVRAAVVEAGYEPED
jgi:copper chaperone